MIFGVTGLIGSGKSTVARVFARMGATLIDCDRIGKEVVESDPAVLYRLVLEFGSTILTADKKLDRRRLGQLAFSSPEKTARLNAIVHPALLAELDNRIQRARRRHTHAVVDAALLVYWKYYSRMDATILVSSYARLRTARLRRAGLSREEIGQRTKSQLSLAELHRHSDRVITNNKDLLSLQRKARKLYHELTERG